jgi:lysophospholipase L1-like esterase
MSLFLLTMAALVTSGCAELFRIVVYGDSSTYGWIPNLDPPSTRYSPEQRWPGVLQKELGSNFQVIEEGLDGRTTDARDPESPISGAQLDGSAYLQACLASHLPVDLVAIMLGTNDLKSVFNRTPLRIAMGATRLIDLVNTLNGGVGTTYKNPQVLLVCPPPLNPEIEKGPTFGEMFKGGVEKSRQLPPLYETVAKMGGAEFLNAGRLFQQMALTAYTSPQRPTRNLEPPLPLRSKRSRSRSSAETDTGALPRPIDP